MFNRILIITVYVCLTVAHLLVALGGMWAFVLGVRFAVFLPIVFGLAIGMASCVIAWYSWQVVQRTSSRRLYHHK